MDPECYVAPGFEKVANTFQVDPDLDLLFALDCLVECFGQTRYIFCRQKLKDGVEKGGSFAVYYKGELVVNIWGGLADPEKKKPWRKDTLSVFWSSTKGVSSIVVGHLIDRGLLNYTDKVCKFWPEFAQKGKEDVTVKQVLLHSSGLPQLDGEWALKEYANDYPSFEKRLAEQEPYWKPGTEEFGYHSLTFALYLDAIVRKVDPKKRSLAQYFDDEFAKPLGLEFYIGLPPEKFDRSTTLAMYKEDLDLEKLWAEIKTKANPKYFERSMAHHSPVDLQDVIGSMNDKEMRAIPCGSSHGSGTAESMAKLYGILADSGKYGDKQVLSPEAISALEDVGMTGVDQMFGLTVQRGMGSMLIPIVVNNNLDEPVNLFGHPGAGGQFAYGDRSVKLGLGYTTNFLKLDMAEFEEPDPRFGSYLNATYSCISKLEGTNTQRKIFANYGMLQKARDAAKAKE